MNFKSLILFSLILILSVSMVSAQDINDDGVSFDESSGVDDENIIGEDAQDELSSQNIIYISPDGAGTGESEDNPTNWNNALYKSQSGDTIHFANGTYTNIKGDINKDLTLKGSGSTVLDAEKNDGFFTIGGKYSKPTVKLTDLSFVNAYTGKTEGNPDGAKTGFDGEGAIVNGGTLIIKNCYFGVNQGIGTKGGAIHNEGTCYVYDSTFFNNGGKKGGAFYSDSGSKLYLYNCIVNKCISREGSAVHAKEAYVEIHNCKIENSSAKNGLFYVKESTVKIYDTSFYNSKAVDAAGVINIDKNTNVYIDNCTFDKISSTGKKLWFHEEYGSGDGGVIVVEKDAKNVEIKNSLFTNCTAKGYGGVLYINASASVTIDNCTFKDNTAAYGSNIYCAKYASMITIINSEFEVKSTIQTYDIDYGETEIIKVTVDDGTNNLLNPTYSIYVNKQEYPLKDNQLELIKLNVGNYTAFLRGHDFNSNKYTFTQESSLFIVGGENLKANVSYSFNDDGSLNIKIIDEYNRAVSNKEITVTIDGENYTANTDINGIATIAPNLNEGEHNIIVNVPGKIIDNSKPTITVVNNIDVPITDEVTVNYSYNDDGTINVEVKDKYDRAVSNTEVKITINDITYNATTDDKGIANIKPSNNVAGEYNVKVEVTGKTIISSPETIKVNPSTSISSIIADDLKRAVNSAYDFKVRLLDKNANPLKNKQVTLVINGNDYIISTDEYGYAYLKNTLSDGEFNILIENPATGEKSTKKLTIVKRIINNKDIKVDYTSSGTYKIRVYADNGQVAGAGEKVTIKLNGKSSTVLTDKNGYASFKISGLTPKTYTVTAEYKGVKVSNKITVNQILKAANKKYKRYKVKKYTATLKVNGKAVKGKKITFKIKGKTYKAKTNAKGVATIKIKGLYKIGKHKITVSYLKTSIKKTITIKR